MLDGMKRKQIIRRRGRGRFPRWLCAGCGIALALALCFEVVAETTPLTQPLQEEKEITITCELTQAPKAGEVPIFSSPQEAERSKGTYHYKLWLPRGYLADTQQRWPCLFIASPGGNADMGHMARWLKANQY